MATSSYPEIRERIDSGSFVFNQYLIIFICFLLNFADGFDLMVMAMAAPSISTEWQLDAKALGVIFSSALAGMTMGAMFLAPLSDRFGRRIVILFAVSANTLSILATAYAASVSELVMIRFITGLGVGAVLVSTTSMATEFAPEKRRSFAVVLVQCGYAAGAISVGPMASVVIGSSGWETLFIYGSVLNAMLFVVALLLLPESIEHLAAKRGDDGKRLARINRIIIRIGKEPFTELPVRSNYNGPPSGSIKSLLNETYRSVTLRLWAIFFLVLWINYFLANWIPKLFVNAGFSNTEAIFALTVYASSAFFGALSIGIISIRFNLKRAIATMYWIGAIVLGICIQVKPENIIVLYAFWACIAFTVSGADSGLFAVAAETYPAEIRATGVGWCIGLGRSGAIISPIVAGYLVAAGWGMYSLFLILAMPAIILVGVLVIGIKT